MLGPPLELAHTALAVGLVTTACVGLLFTIPAQVSPDAPAVADAIVDVAGATPPAVIRIDVDADAITVSPSQITLEHEGKRASAAITTTTTLAVTTGSTPVVCTPERLEWVTMPVTHPIDGTLRISHRWCGTESVVIVDV